MEIPDHTLVARLLDLADGTQEEVVKATADAGFEVALPVIFAELLPRLGGKDTVIRYELSLPEHHGVHDIHLLPGQRRTVLRPAMATEPALRLRHDARGFVDLFRAMLGGRRDLGAALFGGIADFTERPGLAELAGRHGSCKWGAHWGPSHYERYLAPLRDRRITILEIGVGGHHLYEGGESLRMWREFFPRAMIFGIDLYDKKSVEEQRIRIFRGDQSDERFLDSVVGETGPLDLVIDDGSHVNQHVLTAFRHLFPHLRDGGLYVIEDLQSSYWPAFGGDLEDRATPAISTGFLKTLIDGLQHQEFLRPPGYEPSYLDTQVAGLHVHHLFAVVEKGANTEPSSKGNWMRYLDLERPMAALEIGPEP